MEHGPVHAMLPWSMVDLVTIDASIDGSWYLRALNVFLNNLMDVNCRDGG